MNKNKAMMLFKKYCKKYIELFGLKNFEYDITWDDPDDEERRRAGFNMNLTGGLVTIWLSRDWIRDSESSEKEIERTAFHEICETMLCQLRSMADEYHNYDRVDKEIHRVIRRLENFHFKI